MPFEQQQKHMIGVLNPVNMTEEELIEESRKLEDHVEHFWVLERLDALREELDKRS